MAQGTFNSTNFTSSESVSLVNEMALVGVQDAPLVQLLTKMGHIGRATGRIQSWVERTLDTSNAANKPEGEDPITGVYTDRRELNNALEILSKASKVSGTAQAIENGILAEEIQMRLIEVKRSLNRELISSVYSEGSTGNRSMRGLVNWVTAENKVTAPAVTEQAIKDGMRVLYTNGTNYGSVIAIVDADTKEAIDELFKDRISYQHNVDIPVAGVHMGVVVSSFTTNFGTVYFMVDRDAPADTITFANADFLYIDYLRAPHYEPTAKTGDASGGFVIAEATLRVMSPKAVSQVVIG